MSPFSYQHPTFLLDAVFYQNQNINNPTKSTCGYLEDGGMDSTAYFSQFYSSDQAPLPAQNPFDVKIHEGSCVEQNSRVGLSDNEHSVTKKQSTDSSSVVLDKLEGGEQVTQTVTSILMDRKRKNRDASSFTTCADQSKGARDGEGKKQKKCNDSTALKDEEKKRESDEKNEKKVAEEAPKGYIHVRARRGQATDSHSLAERVRREKISERMKLLQALVPGCDKVTGKALMLDEIINYVQSLQNQVEFLSMKLASLNPMYYNFGMDLESFMVRPDQRLSRLASPQPSAQQCSPTRPTAFASANNTFPAPNNYPFLDSSSSLLLQQPQRPNALSQNNGSLLWETDDQRQKFFIQSGFNSNPFSFH